MAIAYIITGVLPAPLIPYGGFVVVFMDCKYCIAFILKNGNTSSFTKVSYLSVASLDTVDSSSSLASPSDQESVINRSGIWPLRPNPKLRLKLHPELQPG